MTTCCQADNSPYPGTNTPEKIIVHHSAVAGTDDQFEGINNYHKEIGFPLSNLGFYVGYHYLINPAGEVKQCREDTEGGAHTVGQNFSSIGICMEGDFDTAQPTQAQKDALYKLCRGLCEKYTISPTEIYPHRIWANKSCYGNALRNAWGAFTVMLGWIDELTQNLDSVTAQIK